MTRPGGTATALEPGPPSWTGAAAERLERAFPERFGGPPSGVWAAPAVLPLLGALGPGTGAALLTAVDEWAVVAVHRRRDGGLDVLADPGAPAASRSLAAAAEQAAVRLAVRELAGPGAEDPVAAARSAAATSAPGTGVAVLGADRHPEPVELGALEPELRLVLLDSGQCDTDPSAGRRRVLGDLAGRGVGDARSTWDGRLRRYAGAEEARVGAAVRALRAGDVHEVASLMTASHSSARVDLRLSSVQVEATVGAALGAGALGARLVAPAFWGPVLAVVPSSRADEVTEAVRAAAASSGFPLPRASWLRLAGGARRVR